MLRDGRTTRRSHEYPMCGEVTCRQSPRPRPRLSASDRPTTIPGRPLTDRAGQDRGRRLGEMSSPAARSCSLRSVRPGRAGPRRDGGDRAPSQGPQRQHRVASGAALGVGVISRLVQALFDGAKECDVGPASSRSDIGRPSPVELGGLGLDDEGGAHFRARAVRWDRGHGGERREVPGARRGRAPRPRIPSRDPS